MNVRNSLIKLERLSNQSSLIRNLAARNISTSGPNMNRIPLNLTDMERRLVPNPLEPIKSRFKIIFGMLAVDTSFRYGEFSKGALQVQSF
jgi:hypothetical protein